jgi:hypothetical protein
MPAPDFNNFLKVLRREPVERPVLFEFYMDWEVVYDVLGDKKVDPDNPPYGWVQNAVQAYTDLGYDCFCMGIPTFQFENLYSTYAHLFTRVWICEIRTIASSDWVCIS